MSINVFKSMAFYKSLSEGNGIPDWAGELNATYGYPLFAFTYPLPYYVISLFHFMGLGFIASVKATMASFYLASGLAFYLYSRNKIATIFYLFAPYHLIDLHYRVALGELASFVWLPLALHFVNKSRPILLAVTLALLILSHQAISLFFIPLLLAYCLFKKLNLKFMMLTFGLALLLSAFYWLPILFETQFTHQPQSAKIVEFRPLADYLYSTWKLGFLWQGPYGKLTFPVGYIHLPIIILCAYFLRTHSESRFWSIAFILLFLLMQSISRPLWQLIPLINNIQFTYRLMVILSFISAILAGLFFSKVQTSPITRNSLIFLVIITSALAWFNRRTDPNVTDQILAADLPLATSKYGEGFSPASPKWVPATHLWLSQIPPAPAEILSGSGTLTSISRTTNTHIYSINAKTDIQIKENTLYFPGWQLIANNQPVSISPNLLGLITFSLPPGQHDIKLTFRDTPIRAFSKQISLLSLLVLILLYARTSALRPA